MLVPLMGAGGLLGGAKGAVRHAPAMARPAMSELPDLSKLQSMREFLPVGAEGMGARPSFRDPADLAYQLALKSQHAKNAAAQSAYAAR